MNYFSKSLRAKIILMASVLELVLVAIVFLSYYTIDMLNQRDKLRIIEASINTATQFRIEFSKTRDLNIAKKFYDKINKIDAYIDELESSQLYSLNSNKDNYVKLFKQYVDTMKYRGLDENNGIEGEFRNGVHNIENMVYLSRSKDLIINILQARRSEKDFIMRKSSKYITKVENSISQFKKILLNSGMSSREKSNILKYSDYYLEGFYKLVNVFKILNSMENQFEKLELVIKDNSEELVAEKSKIADNTQFILIIIISLTVICSVIWSFIIAKAISKPIIELNNTTLKIAEGNYDVRINVNSNDEIGVLSNSFRTMLQNIKLSKQIILDQQEKLVDANIELEDRVEDRTAQLEDALIELRTEMDEKNRISTELIIAQENLELALQSEREINELKTRFVSMVSHEYRTPLTVILSSTYILEKCKINGESDMFSTQLSRIQDSVKLMTALLEDVLILGKSDTGNVSTRYTEFDLVDFMRKSIDNLKYVDMGKHNIKLNYQTNNIFINSDPIIINHILSNLLSNASKYSDYGSEIIVSIDSTIDEVQFSVEDNGIGIPQQDIGNLFEPFHRSNNVGSISGTGLGLTIAKRLIETLNGNITVTSEVNYGTIFTVTLPKNLNHTLN